MKKNWMFALLISLLLIALIAFYIYSKNCSGLECIAIAHLGDYTLTSINNTDPSILKASYVKGNTTLKTNISKVENLKHANGQISKTMTRVIAMHADAPAPYPGVISDKIVCDAKFTPQVKKISLKTTEITYIDTYLTERMGYGACTEDQVYYRGIEAVFYCENQNKLYDLTFITPKNNYEGTESEYLTMLNSVACR